MVVVIMIFKTFKRPAKRFQVEKSLLIASISDSPRRTFLVEEVIKVVRQPAKLTLRFNLSSASQASGPRSFLGFSYAVKDLLIFIFLKQRFIDTNNTIDAVSRKKRCEIKDELSSTQKTIGEQCGFPRKKTKKRV